MDDLYWLAISGRVNIPQPLELDTEYQITGVLSVYGVNRGSKQDGSFNNVFKSAFLHDVLLLKGDQVIPGKDKEHHSQKLRKAIFARGHEYTPVMTWILNHKLDELFEEYEQNNP